MRLFLAVTLADGLRTQIAQVQQELKQRLCREAAPGWRMAWVQVASIHLTLKFLGETEAQRLAPLHEVMAPGISACQAVAIPLERLGVFPRPHHPRVIWLGPSATWLQRAEAEPCAALQGTIEALCARAGFARDHKPFYPHLTMARLKDGARSVGQALTQSRLLDQPLSLEPLTVTSVVLLQSTLRPGGAVYTNLWEVPLQTS